MIDPIISLAVNMEDAKGTYALLIGSGVSRGAGIPTGWEMTVDLIRRIADLEEADIRGEPEEWWRKRVGRDPDYSELVQELAGTSGDRQRLLAPYFEPTPEELEDGVKTATAAHRAIADLIVGGWVRVIITTNFDRLLEQAIQERGIAIDVIASVDQIDHATPIIHSDATIIKLHGDYRDSRIRNTPEELGTYPSELDQYLRRVLQDHGLVVAGWSGDWDPALATAVAETSPRYATYWAHRGPLTETADSIASSRVARLIKVSDANLFFKELVGRVEAVSSTAVPDPRSVDLSISAIKRYIPRVEHRIELAELLAQDTQGLHERHAAASSDGFSADNYLDHLDALVEISGPLSLIAYTMGRWGSPDQAHLIASMIESVMNHPYRTSGRPSPDIDRLPALLVAYSAAIGAMERDDRASVAEYLETCRMRNDDLQPMTGTEALTPWSVLRHERLVVEYKSEDGRRFKYPAAHWLRETLAELLSGVLGREMFDQKLDDVEYMHALLSGRHGERFFPGEFVIRLVRHDRETWSRDNASSRFEADVSRLGTANPLLTEGWLGDSLDGMRAAHEALDSLVEKTRVGPFG